MEEDYPRELLEFEKRFSTEEACREYLIQLRWPNGFICPRCKSTGAWKGSRCRLICKTCRHQASAIAGTIFQDTRKPLPLWFRVMWHVTSQKYGANALGIQRLLDISSYETAWAWLHKLRRAMVRPGRDKLSGRVEVDETYVGTDEGGQRGRAVGKKMLVIIAAQEDGKSIGRIRMACIADASAKSINPFVNEAIEIESTIHTDGWEGYSELKKLGYNHEITILKNRGKHAAIQCLPRVHRVSALLKRWLLGTYQGAASAEYLDYYLDEYTFRFNRRTSGSRGKLFYRLVQQAVQMSPVPYNYIVKSKKLIFS